MRKLTLNIYSDPGHAWCKVPRKLLAKLGIADQITTYSYQRNDSVYLEEDCDLGTFIVALNKAGVSVAFREFNTNKQSKIRSYNHYTLTDRNYHESKEMVTNRP